MYNYINFLKTFTIKNQEFGPFDKTPYLHLGAPQVRRRKQQIFIENIPYRSGYPAVPC